MMRYTTKDLFVCSIPLIVLLISTLLGFADPGFVSAATVFKAQVWIQR